MNQWKLDMDMDSFPCETGNEQILHFVGKPYKFAV